MKKLVSLLLVSLLLSGLFAITASAEDVTLIDKASEWEYVDYEESAEGLTATAPEGWLNKTDSETWKTSQAPFTEGVWGKAIETHTDFVAQYYSAFLRKTFTVSDPSELNGLTLNIIYDENPTVYINGTEVWSATGYKDGAYNTFDLTDKLSALKAGENLICVSISNVNGGGVFDLELSGHKGEIETVDGDGHAVITEATKNGFADFGDYWNGVNNMLDMNQNTVSGSGFDANVEQYFTFRFAAPVDLLGIFVQCKDEGTTTNEDGSRGTYDLYAIAEDGDETKLGELKAVTGTDGGAQFDLSEPVRAAGYKIVITSWQGDCWACVADTYALARPVEDQGDPTPAEPTPVEPTPVDPTPVNPTPDDPNSPSDTPAGENTAVFVLIALISLFGCAVVCGKFRKEH